MEFIFDIWLCYVSHIGLYIIFLTLPDSITFLDVLKPFQVKHYKGNSFNVQSETVSTGARFLCGYVCMRVWSSVLIFYACFMFQCIGISCEFLLSDWSQLCDVNQYSVIDSLSGFASYLKRRLQLLDSFTQSFIFCIQHDLCHNRKHEPHMNVLICWHVLSLVLACLTL